MGPSNSTSHMLPQIWQRINESHLRHRTTLEIIEEHILSLNDQDEQMSAVIELQKRITLYHPGIPKVIYFRQSERDGACSVFGREYQVMMYTQYRGDCLQSVAEEKGERLFYSPCQCVQILNAISYLREHYGSFAVTPKMVFLRNRRQRMSKVWIHSKIESSFPQFSVNEWEMCDSVCKLMHFMNNKRICMTINQQQIQTAASLRQFKELQNFITSVHKVKNNPTNMIFTRKKASSQFAPQTNKQQIKNFAQKAIDKLNSNHKNSAIRNTLNPKPPKIQFVYQRTNFISTQSSLPHIKNKQSHAKVQMPNIHFNKQSMQTQNNNYFSPNKDMNKPSQPVSFFNSPNSCTESITKQTNISEQEDKGTFSRLPTTSRSPKFIKEHNFHTIQEVPETERIFTSQDTRPQRKHKTVSLHSSAKKFEKYREAIKRYQEKMRQKFANSTGSNPLAAKRKKDLVMPKAVATPTRGQYKETESVYNNSEKEEPVARNIVSIEKITFYKNQKAITAHLQNLKDQKQKDKQANYQQLTKKKHQQNLKNLFERPYIDLASINSGQEDFLLKGNDESSRIRDKIKQKKETFAQLKAEATKILQDIEH